VIPYSNSSVEREFSKLALIKTVQRNRLQSNSIEACLVIKQEDRVSLESLYSIESTSQIKASAKIFLKSNSIGSNPSSIEANTKLVTEEEEKSSKVNPNTGSQEMSNFDLTAVKRQNLIPLEHQPLKRLKESTEVSKNRS